jgi:hypothetical protein
MRYRVIGDARLRQATRITREPRGRRQTDERQNSWKLPHQTVLPKIVKIVLSS